ncbi:hypothetical protein [Nocardioides sp. Leaf285]|uniref:hypothetical protein n=1 Tax=Nocardioides sp. Leaf285 TaxID=1736322 RepID=UPI000702DCDD|nr:hypothetical protein [Nocardioides sp. Leaf285]KQP63019.1 hypothetical protein ASF47_18580 [Nocardioides sp. Leaf285]
MFPTRQSLRQSALLRRLTPATLLAATLLVTSATTAALAEAEPASTERATVGNPSPYAPWPTAPAPSLLGDLAAHDHLDMLDYPWWSYGFTLRGSVGDPSEIDDGASLPHHPTPARSLLDDVDIDAANYYARVRPDAASERYFATRLRFASPQDDKVGFGHRPHTRVTYWFTYLDAEKKRQRTEFRVDRRNAPYLATEPGEGTGEPSETWRVVRNGASVTCRDWTNPGTRTAHAWIETPSGDSGEVATGGVLRALTHQIPVSCIGSRAWRSGVTVTTWAKDPAKTKASRNPATSDSMILMTRNSDTQIDLPPGEFGTVSARLDTSAQQQDPAAYQSLGAWDPSQNVITLSRDWDPFGTGATRPATKDGLRPFVLVDPQGAAQGRTSRYVFTLTPTTAGQATVTATADGERFRCASRLGLGQATGTALSVSFPRKCLPPRARMLRWTSERKSASPAFLITDTPRPTSR